MSRPRCIKALAVGTAALAFGCCIAAEEAQLPGDLPVHHHIRMQEADKDLPALPPLPEGVSELGFDQFYKMPIGPRGLEPTDQLLGLNGKRVRIVGYMVQAEEPVAGVFMLAPFPVALAERADGPADDLPAATIFVHMPAADRDAVMPFRAGRWMLTGTLDLGATEEVDGRVSYIRLQVDKAAGAEPSVVAGSD
jgi:hypothetical protein